LDHQKIIDTFLLSQWETKFVSGLSVLRVFGSFEFRNTYDIQYKIGVLNSQTFREKLLKILTKQMHETRVKYYNVIIGNNDSNGTILGMRLL
jgi:hypothetical protein